MAAIRSGVYQLFVGLYVDEKAPAKATTLRNLPKLYFFIGEG